MSRKVGFGSLFFIKMHFVLAYVIKLLYFCGEF